MRPRRQQQRQQRGQHSTSIVLQRLIHFIIIVINIIILVTPHFSCAALLLPTRNTEPLSRGARNRTSRTMCEQHRVGRGRQESKRILYTHLFVQPPLNNDDDDDKDEKQPDAPPLSNKVVESNSSSSNSPSKIDTNLLPPLINIRKESILFGDNPATQQNNNSLRAWRATKKYLPFVLTGARRSMVTADDNPMAGFYNMIFVRLPTIVAGILYAKNVGSGHPLIIDLGSGPTEVSPLIVAAILYVILR